MKYKLPKSRLFAIVVIASIILSVLLELFVFDFKYFTTSKEEKGRYEVGFDNITYNDMERDGEKLKITGDDPYFEIQGDRKILDLKLELVRDTNNFTVTPIVNGITGKTYEANNILKSSSYISVNEMSNNVKFKIDVDKDAGVININKISVDNTFAFNWVRFNFMLSVGLILGYLIIYRDIAREKLHVTFIILALGIGINMSIMTPPYRTFDEKEHFVKAYEVANLELGYVFHPNIEWVGNVGEFLASNGGTVYQSYKERLDFVNTYSRNDYVNVARFPTTASTYLFVAYIPSAIGIAIGKILSLPFILTFYLGRLTSLITFSLIGFYSIKNIKIAKRLLFMILLLPTVLYSAGAYSSDGATISFAILSIVIFINMLADKEKNIDIKKVGLFVFCVAVLTMSKVPYAPFCLLILAVPNNRFKNRALAIYNKLGVLGATGVFAAITFWYANSKNLEQWVVPGISSSEQTKYIIHNVFTYAWVVFNSFSNMLFSYLSGAFGQLAYAYEFKSMYVVCMCVALAVVAIIDNENDVLQLTGKDKIFIALSVILSWGLTVTALYLTFNTVGSSKIEGVQGRYLQPILIPVLLLLKNNIVISNFSKKKLNYILNISFISVLIYTGIQLLRVYNM